MHTYDTGHLELPFHPGHHVYRIGAADSYSEHSQAARIGSVRVGSYHHSSGECVILKYYLVDDSGARLPETYAVAGGRRLEKSVNFSIGLER